MNSFNPSLFSVMFIKQKLMFCHWKYFPLFVVTCVTRSVKCVNNSLVFSLLLLLPVRIEERKKSIINFKNKFYKLWKSIDIFSCSRVKKPDRSTLENLSISSTSSDFFAGIFQRRLIEHACIILIFHNTRKELKNKLSTFNHSLTLV